MYTGTQMPRLGCCGNMNAAQPDGTGIEIVGLLKELGYDYIELPLAQMAALSAQDFEQLCLRLQSAGISCEACNNFFPAALRLTGPAVSDELILEYVNHALGRAGHLGVKVVVFGSGPAKQIPDGFPYQDAWDQLVRMLRQVSEIAGQYGITIAIEPLRRKECNLINTAQEGVALVKAVSKGNIRLLVDYYHLSEEKENPAILLEAAPYLAHVHLANPDGRIFPRIASESNYALFFSYLKQIGYTGRVSMEAYSRDLRSDAAAALNCITHFFR